MSAKTCVVSADFEMSTKTCDFAADFEISTKTGNIFGNKLPGALSKIAQNPKLLTSPN